MIFRGSKPLLTTTTNNQTNAMNGPRDDEDDDNHANQLNPNNDAYWEGRGEDGRPDDWEEQAKDDNE